MAKTTCQDCNRTVVLVDIGEQRLMVDPELIRVVPASQRPAALRSDGTGGIAMAHTSTWARRLHGELCLTYQAQAARDKIAREQRAYNRKNGRPAAPKRNHGL